MDLANRILWTEGMLLSPQHLQQQVGHSEALLESRLSALEPLCWGILELKIDEKTLQSNEIALECCTAVLPDGTLLELPSGSPELPPSRPVGGHFPATQTVLDVYLALPRERSGVPATGPQKGGRTRFFRGERSISDSQCDGSPRDLAVSLLNPIVLFGDEPRDDYVSIKIAEVVRDDANELIVSPPYIAPCLRMNASPFLMSSMRRLFTAMRTRRSALAASQRERDASSVEYGARDVTRFLLLNAINTYLPVMRHLSETGDLHPRAAYLWLSQLAGQLASFSANFDPVDLPPFQHTDLRASFEGLFAKVLSLLHASLQESFVGLDLKGRPDGMFLGELREEKWGECHDFYLAVSTNSIPQQDLGEKLPRLSKVASWQDINSILTAASPGAATQVVFRPPPQLPVRAGVSYFQVHIQNDFWTGVMRQRQLAVFLPRPFDPEKTQVRLVGIHR